MSNTEIIKDWYEIVHYVVVRADLKTERNWPFGAVIAQASHAVAALLEEYKDDLDVKKYLQNRGDVKHIVLKADSEELLKLSDTFQHNFVANKLWIKDPGIIPTCIAIKPYPRLTIDRYVDHLEVFNEF